MAKKPKAAKPGRTGRQSKAGKRRVDSTKSVEVSVVPAGKSKMCPSGIDCPTDAVLEDDRPTETAFDRYLNSERGRLEAGDPPFLTRKQKLARRGLPKRDNLTKLAWVWLETTHECWPELVESGIVPPLNDSAVFDLVCEFEGRFIKAQLSEFIPPAGGKRPWTGLAAGYVRYSDDNSNPRSLDDQLRLQIRKSRNEKRFLPWQYVFADASVTGRTHLRRGYRLAKEAMVKFEKTSLDTFFFDDFGRATRAAIESYRLAKLMERLRKRLLGVSDGFDLSSPNAKVVLMATAMFNEMFIEQLRAKVLRGMRGAAERGTALGRPRYGYRLVQMFDENGKPKFHSDGTPVRVAEICREDMEKVMEAANLFVAGTSYGKIARMFNDLKIGGRTSWGASTIRDMLACPLYIGVAIFNRTRTEFDVETGEFTVKPNDHCEWVRKVIPSLAAWPIELWRSVRRRAYQVRQAAPQTGKTQARNQAYPTTLFSGSLFCKFCECELLLIRSTAKYKQLACLNGMGHKHDCPLSTSKSTRIVEESLLGWAKRHALNPERIEQLVGQANHHLNELANAPRHNTRPIQVQIQKLEREEAKLVTFVLANQEKHDVTAYLKRGDDLRKDLAKLRKQLRDVNTQNSAPPRPLVLSDVLGHLDDIRELLNESITESAEILRQLFGPIFIHQEKEPGKRGAVWIAEFKANVIKLMAAASRRKGYPDASTWEFLTSGNWINQSVANVRIEDIPQYELLAQEFRKMHARGVSLNGMAAAMGKAGKQAKEILEFALTGVRPRWPNHKRTGENKGKTPPYKQIAEEVVRRHDVEGHSFDRIARELGRGESTVRRAFDYLRPEAAKKAAEHGIKPDRGRYSHLGPKVYDKIRELLLEKRTPTTVAKQAGCSISTVFRVKNELIAQRLL